MIEPKDELEATLRLRIEGLLRTEPAPEPIAFDTLVDAATAEVQVEASLERSRAVARRCLTRCFPTTIANSTRSAGSQRNLPRRIRR